MKYDLPPGHGLLLATVVSCLPASAAPITWTGGNADWNASNANWSPADEPDATDEAIFNTANDVNLANASETILALTLSGSIDLDTNGNDLVVDGLVLLSDASTHLYVGGAGSLLTADSVAINSGSTIHLTGGSLIMVEETGEGSFYTNPGGTLTGNGVISLDDGVAAGTVLMISGGTLTATSTLAGDLFGNAAATLTITAEDDDARIDLDNSSGVVNVSRNDTLDINAAAHGAVDPYGGTLNLAEGSRFDMSVAWQTDTATINANTSGIFVGTAGAAATIAGAAFTLGGGSINLDDIDSLRLSSPFTTTAGTIANAGHVILNAATTIGAGTDFQMTGASASLTVEAGVTVDLNDADFNADGTGTTTNIITVNSGGILDLDLGAGADEGLTGVNNLNGGELDVTTADNTWGIDGPVNVGASTGTSQINGDAVTFSSTTVTVGNGSILDVGATSTWSSSASAAVGTGSTLRLDGGGTVLSGGAFTAAGTLALGSTSTVSANTTIATGTFDWDGAGSGSLHTINNGVSFTINSAVFDSDGDMDDPLNLGGSGATLTVSGPAEWTMRRTLTANPGALGTAHINGTSRLILADATGILNVDGYTAINAPLTFGPLSTTSIDAGQTLDATDDTIHDGGSISGAGNYLPGLTNTVVADSSITTSTFDFDEGNWTISPDATFTVNVTDYESDATNAFNGNITLNSGSANVTTGDASFVMDGTLNLNHAAGHLTQWQGEPLEIGNDNSSSRASLNTGGAGQSTLIAQVDFNSDADVTVAAATTLYLASTANFDTVNGPDAASFTGTGTLSVNGVANFNEACTFTMSGGSIDLDGLDLSGNVHNLDAPVVMNVGSLFDFGKINNAGTNTLEIDSLAGTGILTVNLDNPAGEWTLNAPGVINLINDNSVATMLAGVDINLNGIVNVTGDVRTGARVDIAGTVNILTAGQPFRLNGGALVSDPNTIAGGIINGPGILGCDTGTSLEGFGTIHASIDFDVSSDLRAENGMLTLDGGIVDCRNIGTADATGILNVVPAWNSSGVGTVSVLGGELRGGTLTLDNTLGLSGHGLVSARIFNNTVIVASGPTLIVETAANDNDWDGTTNTGTLAATTGTLEVRDTAGFGFTGTVRATNGGTVFTSGGFTLDFNPGSALELTNGTYRASNTCPIGGTVLIGPAADSVIEMNGSTFFEATSTTTLNGNLHLSIAFANIAAGATFSGPGALIVPAGPDHRLSAAANANINVLLDVRGTFQPGGLDLAGRVDVKDYQQAATGNLVMEVTGTALNQFDRIIVNGGAQLAGTLNLDLDGGFLPVLGQTFNILSTVSGVSGTFATVAQPPGMPAGLKFQVNYLPTITQLEVVAVTPYEAWIDSFVALTDPADKLKTANPDADALDNLGEFALDGDPASGKSSGKIVGKIAPVGGVNAMTLTFPVRTGTILDPADPAGGQLGLKKAADGVTYTVQASDNLSAFTLEVTEVIGADATAIQTGLTPASSGWGYRTFRSPGPIAGDPVEFMRVVVGE